MDDYSAPGEDRAENLALDFKESLGAATKRTELLRQHNVKRFGRDIGPPKDTRITAASFTGNVGIADGLDVSLAPGCYGMSMCFREGTAECSTCPFAASCKPRAEDQAAMLRREGVRNMHQERDQKRQAKHRAALGAKPHSQSASRTKPWEAVGMSRASWYRAGKPSPS